MEPNLPPPNLNLKELLGPIVVGNTIAAGLAGALVLLSFQYFNRFPKDRAFYKASVAIITLISLVTWGIQIYCMFWFTITSRASEWMLIAVPTIIYAPIALATLAQLVSQVYFAYRTYTLCARNLLVGLGFGILILASFALNITSAVFVFRRPKYVLNKALTDYFPKDDGELKRATYWVIATEEADLIVSACTDLIITATLAWKMSTMRQGFRDGTDSLIPKILTLSITTAAVSSSIEIITAVLLFTTLNKNWSYLFGMMLSHVYGLVLVGSLNLRTLLKPSPSTSSGLPTTSNPNRKSHIISGASNSNSDPSTQTTGLCQSRSQSNNFSTMAMAMANHQGHSYGIGGGGHGNGASSFGTSVGTVVAPTSSKSVTGGSNYKGEEGNKIKDRYGYGYGLNNKRFGAGGGGVARSNKSVRSTAANSPTAIYFGEKAPGDESDSIILSPISHKDDTTNSSGNYFNVDEYDEKQNHTNPTTPTTPAPAYYYSPSLPSTSPSVSVSSRANLRSPSSTTIPMAGPTTREEVTGDDGRTGATTKDETILVDMPVPRRSKKTEGRNLNRGRF